MLLRHTNRWHKHAYTQSLEGEENKYIKDVINYQSNKFNGLYRFIGDVYARLYTADNVEKVQKAGMEHFEHVHSSLDESKDFKSLFPNTKGNRFNTGIAVNLLIEELIERLPTPEDRLEDINERKEKLEELKQRIAELLKIQDPNENEIDEIEYLKNEIKQYEKIINSVLETNLKYSEAINKSSVRSGIKDVSNKINEKFKEINKIKKLFGASAFGNDNSNSDIEFAKNIAKIIKDMSSKFKDIVDLAGKYISLFETLRSSKSDIKSTNIIGIEKGRDLEHLIPSELSILGTNEDLFYHRYHKEELDQYELERTKENKGPIIFALDISGSMDGKPHIQSKALLLAMMNHAKQNKRKFSCCLFNHNIVKEWDFEKSNSKLLEIISYKPSGGTDIPTAINWCMDKSKSDTKSDIIFLTDGMDGSGSLKPEHIKNELKKTDTQLISFILNCSVPKSFKIFSSKIVTSKEIDEEVSNIFAKIR